MGGERRVVGKVNEWRSVGTLAVPPFVVRRDQPTHLKMFVAKLQATKAGREQLQKHRLAPSLKAEAAEVAEDARHDLAMAHLELRQALEKHKAAKAAVEGHAHGKKACPKSQVDAYFKSIDRFNELRVYCICMRDAGRPYLARTAKIPPPLTNTLGTPDLWKVTGPGEGLHGLVVALVGKGEGGCQALQTCVQLRCGK